MFRFDLITRIRKETTINEIVMTRKHLNKIFIWFIYSLSVWWQSEKCWNGTNYNFKPFRCQFYQRFMRSVFVRKSFRQLFSSLFWLWRKYESTFVQKNVHVKCWWNWHQSSHYITTCILIARVIMWCYTNIFPTLKPLLKGLHLQRKYVSIF